MSHSPGLLRLYCFLSNDSQWNGRFCVWAVEGLRQLLQRRQHVLVSRRRMLLARRVLQPHLRQPGHVVTGVERASVRCGAGEANGGAVQRVLADKAVLGAEGQVGADDTITYKLLVSMAQTYNGGMSLKRKKSRRNNNSLPKGASMMDFS